LCTLDQLVTYRCAKISRHAKNFRTWCKFQDNFKFQNNAQAWYNQQPLHDLVLYSTTQYRGIFHGITYCGAKSGTALPNTTKKYSVFLRPSRNISGQSGNLIWFLKLNNQTQNNQEKTQHKHRKKYKLDDEITVAQSHYVLGTVSCVKHIDCSCSV